MTSSSDGRNGPEQPPDTDASASMSASAATVTTVTAPDALGETTTTATSATSAIPTTAGATSPEAAAAAATDESAQLAKDPVSPSTPKRNGDATSTTALQTTPRPASGTSIIKTASSTTSSPVDQAMPEAPKDADGDTVMSAGQTQIQAESARQQEPQTQPQSQQQQPLLPPSSPPPPRPPPNIASVATSEQFPPSTPFTPTQMANLDPHAYMMMALASMSGAQNAMSPPPTVTPSQVTLPNLLDDGMNGVGAASALRQANAEKGLESFARIEFADSVFQMTTYAVIIGRDQRALEQARRDGKRADEHQRRVEENASKGLPPPSPIRHDRSKFSKSYVSEEGGMLGPESDSEESGRPPKRRKTSTNGSSQQENEESQDNIISNRQYVSHTPGAAAVDLSSLRPSPYHVPFIGIHSPGPNIAGKTKAISREHLKIAYNQQDGVFEAHPLHKNGFFCEDVHYKSDKVVLKCGDRLQIKDVDFQFIINGVEKGRTGAEEYLEEETLPKKRQSHGGKEMSFDFEQSHGDGEVQDTSDELSDVEISPPAISDGEEGEDEGDGEEGEEGDEGDEGVGDEPGDDSELRNELTTEPDPSLLQIPKKRGPGRPPKNGIMSKREQRLLKKQQQEMAKKTLPQAPPVEPPIKRKVGRPRKHPLPEDAGERPEKRKYKPRKPKEEGGEGSDAERRAKEKKEKKARPKSPPLELKIENYTDEQLQKPNKNYGVLIDETLTAAGPDGLTLKQIYKRICERYPWFYFHTETKGWESSVRHNLIGNEAFKKDETTNLWIRVPGVELDAGKKRKASSPDRALAAQGYGPYSYPYNAAQNMPPGTAAGYPPGQAPPGYQVPGYPAQPGQAPRSMQPYAAAPAHPGQPNSLPAPATAQAAAPRQLAGYGPPPAPARAQPGGSQPGAYSSPYASRPPPPSSNAPVKTEPGRAQPGIAAPAPAQLPPQVTPATAPAAAAMTCAKTEPSPAAPQQTPTPGSGPSATSPTSEPARPVIDPRLLSAVVGLKNGLVENLRKARSPNAEAIVMSALNRCLGLKKEATENDKMEEICIRGIRQVIEGFNKNKSPAPGGSATTETSILEPRVLLSLNGFKDFSVRAIKEQLGDARAEAVSLSAINRVLGFADASTVPQGLRGESGAASSGTLEGVEKHLMSSVRQLLKGMNQKVRDA